jgi:hypothetical protein
MKLQGIFCNKPSIEKKFQFLGEHIVKGAKGVKVKIPFQGLHMTRVIFVLLYNFKFFILDISFNIAF